MFKLSEEQQLAIDLYKTNRILVINGGPGSGKTTILRYFILDGQITLFLAPTGNSALRLEKLAGHPCYTIAKIEFSSTELEFFKNKDVNMIIDESSMVSINSAYRIIRFIKPLRVVFVGDIKQLPCIGAKPVLGTLLRCYTVIPCINFVRNYRQEQANSALVYTIQQIGQPDFFEPLQDEGSLKFVACKTDDEATQRAALAYTVGTQVLAFRDDVCKSINHATDRFNDNRIICTKNLYIKSTMVVANGSAGVIDENKNVLYDNGFVDKAPKYKSKFEIARCITIHKSQGNEYSQPGIIVLTASRHNSAELIYTACSRFKTHVTIFSTRRTCKDIMSKPFNTENVDMRIVNKITHKIVNRKRLKQHYK